MEHMLGLCLAAGFKQLAYEQKRHTATDVAKIVPSLFNITSAECGSIPLYSETGMMKASSTTPFGIRSLPHSFPEAQSYPQRAVCHGRAHQ